MAYANETKGPEAGIYLSGNEYHHTEEKDNLLGSPGPEDPEDRTRLKTSEALHSNKMLSFRRLLIALAVFSIFAVTFTSAAVVRSRNCHTPTEDEARFQELLASVSDASLHEVLEQYIASKYQTGIWPEARTAIKAVHQSNAAIATSLVELAKRQNVSMTTSSDTISVSTGSSSILDPTTTSGSTSVDPGPTTTGSQSTASSETTAPPSTASPKPSDPAVSSPSTLSPSPTTPTPTDGASTATVPPSSAPTNPSLSSQTTATPGTTPQSPSANSTSVPVRSSTSSKPASISSTSQNSPITRTTAESTSSPTDGNAAPSLSTEQVVYTTVHPDGSRSTITSFTIVAAAQSPTKVASSAPSVTPRLQDAAARFDGMGLVGYALIGFVGMVAVL